MKTIVMIESINTKYRGGRINTCRSIIIVWIRTLWSSPLNMQFGIDWFDKSRSKLNKYSMWLWSIYKNIFPRYLELHGCVILPDANGGGQYNSSMQFKVPRENVLVYWPQSHRIFAILYFNSKIINQNKKNVLINVSWHTKWDKQQEMSSYLTVLIIIINSTCAVIKIKYRLLTWQHFHGIYSGRLLQNMALNLNRKSSPGNITHAREFQTWKIPTRGYISWWAWQVKLE
jgi:hypothetical protein